jgi:hypothetical protein
MFQRDRSTYLRRQFIRFLRSPRLAMAYAEYRAAVRACDWPEAQGRAQLVTDIAVRLDERRTISEMILALDRLGCYRQSNGLWLDQLSRQPKIFPNEWRGEDLSGRTVLVHLNHTNRQGLGVGYHCAHILPTIARLARRTVIIVEPRLAKTFKRSFPQLEVLASSERAHDKDIDFVLLPAFLLAMFTSPEDLTERDFNALVPDPDKKAALRRKYLELVPSARKRPLIGISWYSSHHGKDAPERSSWRDFIARADANFVSLQYGDVSRDIAILGHDRVIVDDTIDQMSDMDDFAAQVAALDGVITIINTLTNVAAALNVPTVVLRDDRFRRNLPVLRDRVPWYPSMRVAGKDRRSWETVLDEASNKLRQMIAERSAREAKL